MESDLKELNGSIEFAHAEVRYLKEIKIRKIKDEGISAKTERLENVMLSNSVVDLKARSVRDNHTFYNTEDTDEEDTTHM